MKVHNEFLFEAKGLSLEIIYFADYDHGGRCLDDVSFKALIYQGQMNDGQSIDITPLLSDEIYQDIEEQIYQRASVAATQECM